MRINQVSKKTGLSKRTIYYYIEEQLILPKIDKSNGYNDFSADDIDKLFLIQTLRGFDFSISDIKSILSYPNTTQYLIQRQIEKLSDDYNCLEDKISSLSTMNDNLPIHLSYETLSQELKKVKLPGKRKDKLLTPSSEDVKLVALYLWGTFLEDLPMTQYREFLWQKVQKEMLKSYDKNILSLKSYLHSISSNHLDRVFAKRNLHVDHFANVDEDGFYALVEDMKSKLIIFSEDNVLKNFWREGYESMILPQLKLFDSPINEIVKEMSPRFSNYHKNVQACSKILYDWAYSNDGDIFRKSILQDLNGFVNIDNNHHGELISMAFLKDLILQ